MNGNIEVEYVIAMEFLTTIVDKRIVEEYSSEMDKVRVGDIDNLGDVMKEYIMVKDEYLTGFFIHYLSKYDIDEYRKKIEEEIEKEDGEMRSLEEIFSMEDSKKKGRLLAYYSLLDLMAKISDMKEEFGDTFTDALIVLVVNVLEGRASEYMYNEEEIGYW